MHLGAEVGDEASLGGGGDNVLGENAAHYQALLQVIRPLCHSGFGDDEGFACEGNGICVLEGRRARVPRAAVRGGRAYGDDALRRDHEGTAVQGEGEDRVEAEVRGKVLQRANGHARGEPGAARQEVEP
eukprot:2635254-Pyramimonas_sp.AAC.1